MFTVCLQRISSALTGYLTAQLVWDCVSYMAENDHAEDQMLLVSIAAALQCCRNNELLHCYNRA